jgi:hypothetical protein
MLFVTSAPAYSQDQDATRPGQAQEEKDKARHDDKATKQDESKHEQEQPGARQEEHPGKPEAAPPKREQGEQRQQMEREHQHPAQVQRGKRIPDDKFRASFGPQHTFLVQRTQIINVSQPTIVVSGFSFLLIDAWPAEWAFDDPCFIDFVDDEYFLFDTLHPGIRIAVIVIG